jgi:thiamine pyrophosphate-dependent acetolactate synthase large subunit-like protein
VTADQTACTAAVLEETPDAAVISNVGTASYHLTALGDRARNFPLTGAMGVTTPVGLGLALATDEQVTALDGDGSMLMSLGALSTVARLNPSNLVVVVMDNAAYETTGGQTTLSTEVDFEGVARDCGLSARSADSNEGFREAYTEAVAADGAGVVVCEVAAEKPEEYPPLDYGHSYVKHRFRSEFVED